LDTLRFDIVGLSASIIQGNGEKLYEASFNHSNISRLFTLEFTVEQSAVVQVPKDAVHQLQFVKFNVVLKILPIL
jgi:hypothetical protein